MKIRRYILIPLSITNEIVLIIRSKNGITSEGLRFIRIPSRYQGIFRDKDTLYHHPQTYFSINTNDVSFIIKYHSHCIDSCML